jgi:hypothetical protein
MKFTMMTKTINILIFLSVIKLTQQQNKINQSIAGHSHSKIDSFIQKNPTASPSSNSDQPAENQYRDNEIIGLIGTATTSAPKLKNKKFYAYAMLKTHHRPNTTKSTHKHKGDYLELKFFILHHQSIMAKRISGNLKIPYKLLTKLKAKKFSKKKDISIRITKHEELVTQEMIYKKTNASIKLRNFKNERGKFELDFELEKPGELGNQFSGGKGFDWRLQLKDANYSERLQNFRLIMLSSCVFMILGVLAMMEKIRENFDEYLSRLSLGALFMEMVTINSILYHFGVLLPVDIQCIFPFAVVVLNLSFIWLAKLMKFIQQTRLRDRLRCVQSLLTTLIIITGLFLPSLDEKGQIFLICVLLPLVCQIWLGFRTGKITLSLEYNLKFKVAQILLVFSIFGSKNAVHLLPIDPKIANNFLITFLGLNLVLIVQRYYHPRFFLKTMYERRLMRLRPRIVEASDLVEKGKLLSRGDEESKENGAFLECSICYMELEALDGAGCRCLETPCGHVFHYSCLAKWLEKHKTCPLCRQECIHPDPAFFN